MLVPVHYLPGRTGTVTFATGPEDYYEAQRVLGIVQGRHRSRG